MINLVLIARYGKKITQDMLDGKDKMVQYGLIVSDYFGMQFKDICKDTRKREIVYPRQVLHYLLWKSNTYSLEEIGAAVGQRDHSTVTHGKKVILNLLDYDKNVQNDVEILSESVSNY